jgi:hypothetical protein
LAIVPALLTSTSRSSNLATAAAITFAGRIRIRKIGDDGKYLHARPAQSTGELLYGAVAVNQD